MQYVYGALSPTHNQLARTSYPWRIVRSTSCSSALHAMSTLLGTSHHTHQMSRHSRTSMHYFDKSLYACLINEEEPDPDVVDTSSFMGQLKQVVMLLYAYFLTMDRRPITSRTICFPSSPRCVPRGEEVDNNDKVTSNIN